MGCQEPHMALRVGSWILLCMGSCFDPEPDFIPFWAGLYLLSPSVCAVLATVHCLLLHSLSPWASQCPPAGALDSLVARTDPVVFGIPLRAGRGLTQRKGSTHLYSTDLGLLNLVNLSRAWGAFKQTWMPAASPLPLPWCLSWPP